MRKFTEAAIAETYTDVEQLIWSRCHYFCKKYGDSLDEVKSVANYAFMDAYAKWDPNRGQSFSSYTYMVVSNTLLEKARRDAVRHSRYKILDMLETDVVETDTCHPWFKRETTADVETVIEMAMANKRSLQCYRTPAMRRSVLAKRLRHDLNWDTDRIRNSFREVKEVLGLIR